MRGLSGLPLGAALLSLVLLLHLDAASAAPGPVTLPLYGGVNSAGQGFYVGIGLGTPPQRFKLQIDTGSSDLLVYAKGCVGCEKGTKRFSFSASSTAHRVLCNDSAFHCKLSGCSGEYCTFDDEYADGSYLTGQIATDVLTVKDLTSTISWGMVLNSSKDFVSKPYEGIWGLGGARNSAWHGTPAFLRLVNETGINDCFSMCLTTSNPTITLGASTTNDTSFTWTHLLHEGAYVVKMNDLLVNGVSLGYNSTVYNSAFGAIIDSGTTQWVIPRVAWKALYASYLALCNTTNLPGVCAVSKHKSIFAGGGGNRCVQMTAAQRALFPKLTVMLEGATPLTVGGASTLLELRKGCYSIGLASEGKGTTLGDVFMQGFNIVFDRANRRMGFGAVSTCPSL